MGFFHLVKHPCPSTTVQDLYVTFCHGGKTSNTSAHLMWPYYTKRRLYHEVPYKYWIVVEGQGGGHGGRVVTLSPPISEAGVQFPARHQVGKLVVTCHWSAVYSIEP